MAQILLLAPHPFFQERGTPIADLAVARVLIARGYEVHLLAFHEGEEVDLPGLTIHRIPRIPGVRGIPPGFSWKKIVCDVAMIVKAIVLVRKHRYRLVHAVEESAFIAAALRLLFGLPYVYDMDSALPQQTANQVAVARYFLPLMKAVERGAMRGAAGILTMCRSLESRAARIAPDVPIGRAEDIPLPLAQRGSERLSETIGRGAVPLILYVGNLMPYQGIDLLLEAFRVAARSTAEAHLVLLGGSNEHRDHYRNVAERLGIGDRTHFIGRRPLRLLSWYLSQATVLVSPRSSGENTPMKIYSYMASGVPILATRLPTHTQVLSDEAAVLADPNPEAMGRGLVNLLEDPELRRRKTGAAAGLVAREFTAEAFADKVNSFYDRVERAMGGEQPPPAPREESEGPRVAPRVGASRAGARRVLVTDGTGFVGRRLVRALLERGDEVRVLARSGLRAVEALPPETEIEIGDITDLAVVRRSVRGRDVVFHLAAAFNEAGVPDRRYRQVHVDGTRLVLEASARAKVGRVVHCSTIGVHGHIEDPPADEGSPIRPGDIYQKRKSEVEALAFHQATGYPIAIARPSSIYGPGDLRLLKLFRMIAKNRLVRLGRGEVGFHAIYVDDLVRGILLLAERDAAVGEVFILAGPRSVTLEELTRVIAHAVGAEPPRMRLPAWPLRVEPPLRPRQVASSARHRELGTEKARRVLGWEPRVDLEAGMRLTAEWYAREGLLTSTAPVNGRRAADV